MFLGKHGTDGTCTGLCELELEYVSAVLPSVPMFCLQKREDGPPAAQADDAQAIAC